MREQIRQVQIAVQQPVEHAARCGEEKRQHAREWLTRKQAQEADYLAKARANKAATELTRSRVRAEREAVLRARKNQAIKERDNDYLVAEEKARILADNRREAANLYAKRFVGRGQARRWEGSALSRLHSAAFWSPRGAPSPRGSASPRQLGYEPNAPPTGAEADVADGRNVVRC